MGQYNVLDQESNTHMHEQDDGSDLKWKSVGKVVQEVILGLVACEVVAPTGNEQVETDLERGVDDEDPRKFFGFAHLRHQLKVQPMPCIRIDYVGHCAKECEEAQILSKQKCLCTWNRSIHVQLAHDDANHREDEEEVKETEVHTIRKVAHRDRNRRDAQTGNEHCSGQAHVVRIYRSLHRRAQDKEIRRVPQETVQTVNKEVYEQRSPVSAKDETSSLAQRQRL
mmetsp:Transcript_64599/g.171031  ORF Transcript_64599/g.171031 Transcript_64599/m.171031 type:complete len:225 (+) Transcript_64599:518-1192(+)